jgi:hypothetical protein
MALTRASSVLAVKRALLALLQAEDEFSAATVLLGLPLEEPNTPERVYVLPNLTRSYADLTEQGGKDETYNVPVRIESRMYTPVTVDQLEERLEALAELVIELVDADRELGGACRDAQVSEIDGPFAGPTNDTAGLFGTVTVTVAVDSWL